MSDSHDFCRLTLKDSRGEAKLTGIKLPKRITALRTSFVTRTQWFVESEGFKGEFFTGDCAFEAKTKFVRAIIDGFKLTPDTRKAEAAE